MRQKSTARLLLCCILALSMLLPMVAIAAPAQVEKITFAQTCIGVTAGETVQLTPEISPASAKTAKLSYTSGRQSVASVDENGLVTAYRAGTASITVTAENCVKANICIKVVSKGYPTGITLSNSKLELTPKGTAQLSATISPDSILAKCQKVSYRTSNSRVARVNSAGIVTAQRAGTATITAKTCNGFTATCTVTVSNQTVQPERIACNPTSVSVAVGQTAPLSPVFTPENTTDRTLTYSSSNTTVATVDANGIITGVAVGRATITAKTANGLSARCSVNVTKNPAGTVEVQSLRVYTTSATMDVADSFKLEYLVRPANATNPGVTFQSSDASIASVSAEGIVTGVRAGNATITVTASNGISATCAVTVLAPPAGSTNPGSTNPGSTNPGGTTSNTSSGSSSEYAAEVLRLVNVEREKNGLSALKSHSTLEKAANIRAVEIISYFSHTRPNGTSCFTVYDEVGMNYRGAGENIAAGQRSPSEVVNAWMNSPGHRANILNSKYTYLGVGYTTAGDSYGQYWVQLFAY